MNELLLKPAFRNGAIYIPESWLTKPPKKPLNQTTKLLLSNCGQLGYTFSEELLSKIKKEDGYQNKKLVVAASMDLSAAYNTVNHKILLKKMEYYGVTGNELELFKSYLSTRKQYADIN